jgi:hypothetical protein
VPSVEAGQLGVGPVDAKPQVEFRRGVDDVVNPGDFASDAEPAPSRRHRLVVRPDRDHSTVAGDIDRRRVNRPPSVTGVEPVAGFDRGADLDLVTIPGGQPDGALDRPQRQIATRVERNGLRELFRLGQRLARGQEPRQRDDTAQSPRAHGSAFHGFVRLRRFGGPDVHQFEPIDQLASSS